MKNQFGIIILAAGSSSRLGKPKQNLQFHQQSFLQRIIDTSIRVVDKAVVVVLGANLTEIHAQEEVISINNEQWKEGMASSIRAGLQEMIKNFPSIEAVIITVCDQPYLTADLFQQLINRHQQSHQPIVASSYNNTFGTPVLFQHTVFPELLSLKGDKGAKQIINKDISRVAAVEFPEGGTDIDSQEDYDKLIRGGFEKG